MKLFFNLIAIACFAFTATAQEGAVRDINQFPRLAEKWRLAYNSMDTAMLATMYSNDAEYISAHVNGYILHGRDQVIANFKKGAESGGRLDTVQVLSVNSSGDMATVVTKYVGIAEGKKVNGRNLLFCKHVNSRWMIVTHMTVVRD